MSKQYAISLQKAANSLVQGIEDFGSYTAKAASKANGVSAAAQTAQGNFNQQSANIANNLSTDRINSQYMFNSGQALLTNNFNEQMWDKAAAWNEMMWERQAEFNRQEAQKNRDWQTEMANTAYQRAYADMQKAGINPVLASGASPVMPSGGAASVGGASMGSASGNMASGGLLGANSANVGNYSGQMEYMSGMLGLLSAALGSIGSAQQALSGMGDFGESLGNALATVLTAKEDKAKDFYDKQVNPKNWFSIKPGSVADKLFGQPNAKHGGSHGKTTYSSGNF